MPSENRDRNEGELYAEHQQPSVWGFVLLMALLVLLAALFVFWGLPQLDALFNPPPPPALQPPLRL